MRSAFALVPLLALAACSDAPSSADQESAPSAEPAGAATPLAAWSMASSGEGSGLFLTGMEAAVADRPVVHFFCPKGVKRLLVNIPTFKPVASEERLSIGAGGTAAVLIADPGGDRQRGGVSGEGPIPDDLPLILRAPAGVGVAYGAQTIGPLPAIPADMVQDFIDACID